MRSCWVEAALCPLHRQINSCWHARPVHSWQHPSPPHISGNNFSFRPIASPQHAARREPDRRHLRSLRSGRAPRGLQVRRRQVIRGAAARMRSGGLAWLAAAIDGRWQRCAARCASRSPSFPPAALTSSCGPLCPPAGEPIPYEVPVAGVGTGLRSELQAGEFSLVLDAGKGLGGQQSGPSPVQAFISAIVACTQVSGL